MISSIHVTNWRKVLVDKSLLIMEHNVKNESFQIYFRNVLHLNLCFDLVW